MYSFSLSCCEDDCSKVGDGRGRLVLLNEEEEGDAEAEAEREVEDVDDCTILSSFLGDIVLTCFTKVG